MQTFEGLSIKSKDLGIMRTKLSLTNLDNLWSKEPVKKIIF
jgi:hypothetical protein